MDYLEEQFLLDDLAILDNLKAKLYVSAAIEDRGLI